MKAEERRRRAAVMNRILAKGTGEQAMREAARQLRGEYPTVGFEPISGEFTADEQDALFEHIRTHATLQGFPFTMSKLSMVVRKILSDGHLPTRSELSLIEQVFGPEVVRQLMRKGSFGPRLARIASEIVNVPRTLVTGYDLSATLRQGFDLVVTHPRIAGPAFADQMRALVSEDAALAIDASIRTLPNADLHRQAGLDIPSVTGDFEFTEREEAFISRIVQRFGQAELSGLARILTPFKLHGAGIRASERAYITYLNLLRVRTFDAWSLQLREAGILPDGAGLTHYRELARMVNVSTGRANIDALSHPLWTAMLFSPRFMFSRWEQLFWRLPKNALTGPGPLRRFAARQLTAKAFTWMTIIALTKLAAEAFDIDFEAEMDPRSSDFLKVRFGRTRVDFGAGYGQMIRVVARLATAQRKELTTGRTKEAPPLSVIGTYAKYKLSPVPATALAIREGELPIDREITPTNIFMQLGTPISFQTMLEINQEHGAIGNALLIPELLGLGVNIQESEPATRQQRTAERLRGQRLEREAERRQRLENP